MSENVEQRLQKLEGQVAELMKMKKRIDNKAIEKELRSAEDIGDALLVGCDSKLLAEGPYCRNCWNTYERVTFLDLGSNEIPGANSYPMKPQCPACKKVLKIQYQNRL